MRQWWVAVAYRGRGEIERAMGKLGDFKVTTHVVANQVLDLDVEPVAGETYCTASHVYDTPDGERVYVMSIRYRDTFVRAGEAGAWLFAERRLLVDWTEDRAVTRGDF